MYKIVRAYSEDSKERKYNADYTRCHKSVDIPYSGHRTKDFNDYMASSDCEVLVFSDVDVVINKWQIEEAVEWCMRGCVLAYPYDKMRKLGENPNEFFGGWERGFFGGVFVVNRKKYMSLGGENENFVGWGCEDMERYVRVSKMTLSEPPRVAHECSHLFHPRVERLDGASKNAELFEKIDKMNINEMKEYIETFKWRQKWIETGAL